MPWVSAPAFDAATFAQHDAQRPAAQGANPYAPVVTTPPRAADQWLRHHGSREPPLGTLASNFVQFGCVEVAEANFDPLVWPLFGANTQAVAIANISDDSLKGAPGGGRRPSHGSACAGAAHAQGARHSISASVRDVASAETGSGASTDPNNVKGPAPAAAA